MYYQHSLGFNANIYYEVNISRLADVDVFVYM